MKILLIKLFMFCTYTIFGYAVPNIALQVAENSSVDVSYKELGVYALVFLMIISIIPGVILVFSKNFQQFIKGGVEDNDGELSNKDLGNMMVFLFSYICIIAFLLLNWSVVFYTPIPAYLYYGPLLGAYGRSGLQVITGIIGRGSGKS